MIKQTEIIIHQHLTAKFGNIYFTDVKWYDTMVSVKRMTINLTESRLENAFAQARTYARTDRQTGLKHNASGGP